MMVIIIRINSPINGEDHLDNGKPERKVILSNVEASRVEFVNSSVVAVKPGFCCNFCYFVNFCLNLLILHKKVVNIRIWFLLGKLHIVIEHGASELKRQIIQYQVQVKS